MKRHDLSICTHPFLSSSTNSQMQVGAFGDPGRDPRGWCVSVAYAALVPTTELGVQAADDAQVGMGSRAVGLGLCSVRLQGRRFCMSSKRFIVAGSEL